MHVAQQGITVTLEGHDAASVVPLWRYAGHAPVLGGESPLRSRESGPLSEGKGVAARRGLEEAGATATT